MNSKRKRESVPFKIEVQDNDTSDEDNCFDEAFYEKIVTMPLSKINELKVQLGPELFKKMCSGMISTSSRGMEGGSKRPRETSSKRARLLPPKKEKCFDPRFLVECGGDFDEVNFHKQYGFIDEMRQKEIKEIKTALRDSKRGGDKILADRLKNNLLRLENQQKASTDAHLKEELRANIRNTNIERMKQGQQPIILNKQKFEARLKDAKNTRDNSSSSRGAVNMKSGDS